MPFTRHEKIRRLLNAVNKLDTSKLEEKKKEKKQTELELFQLKSSNQISYQERSEEKNLLNVRVGRLMGEIDQLETQPRANLRLFPGNTLRINNVQFLLNNRLNLYIKYLQHKNVAEPLIKEWSKTASAQIKSIQNSESISISLAQEKALTIFFIAEQFKKWKKGGG